MPNIDFYAAGADFHAVLTYVFEQSKCRVFESYSPPGEELTEFKSIDDLSARYPIGICRGSGPSVLLQLVPPGASHQFSIRRISMQRELCDGHTFRYALEGWDLIHLHLGALVQRDWLIPIATTIPKRGQESGWKSIESSDQWKSGIGGRPPKFRLRSIASSAPSWLLPSLAVALCSQTPPQHSRRD